MTVNAFAVKIAKKEAGKREIDIAQIMEILKVINGLLGGALYKIIGLL